MKKESPLWSSISLLIGIVIAILALIRGRMLLPLLLAVFALWLLWWLLTQALPLWRNNRAYRAKEARLREQTAAANGGGQLADALLCHVNYRITAMLRAAYPNARWEWLADKPSRFAVEGGTARIRVYGIPDFDYADVKLDQKANLDCSLVKLSPLMPDSPDTQPPNRQPVNPRVWFETRGRAVLEALVTDLNSRGHSSLTVQENGEVFVQAKENEAEPAKETFLDFPEKVYWPQLVKVLEEEGYGEPGGTCADCVLNQFGSDGNNKGKACKNMRMLYLLRSGEYMPIQIALPPTSLTPYTRFVNEAFLSRRRKVCTGVVRIGLKKAVSGSHEYCVATFTKIADFAGEDLAHIRAYADGFVAQIKDINAQRAQAGAAASNIIGDGDASHLELPDNGAHFALGAVIDGEREELPA